MTNKRRMATVGASLLLGLGLVGGATPAGAETVWTSGSDFIDVSGEAGTTASGAFAGTVVTHSQFVTVSGVFKINTSIVSITPQPGFSYKVKKSGGINSTVDVLFTSATCQSEYSLLIKPGLTRGDFGVMRCK